MAWELSRCRNSASDDMFTGVLSEAKVDLNPLQVEAALFAFRSPLSKGAVLADEVGKTIEAALVISQKWPERRRHFLVIAPATLRKQWSIKLEDKFFIPSIIFEKNNFNKILNDSLSNPLDTTEQIVICSYHFARKNITHIFEYTKSHRHIAVVKQHFGEEGWLKFRVIRYSSLHEIEAQIVLVALDKDGKEMDSEFVFRLMSLPAKTTGLYRGDIQDFVNSALIKKQAELTESLEVRNSELISEEIVKIENWAEDNRQSLQQKLSDLDKEIDEKNDEFVKERNLRKKMLIQKEKDALMEKRDAVWREFDEQRSTLKSEKNALINKLYEIAENQMSVVDEFTIKWK